MCSHPDKNPDPESKKLFVKVANAYEVWPAWTLSYYCLKCFASHASNGLTAYVPQDLLLVFMYCA
jgi:hypothetical protein